jgi:hypothetical protein
MSSWPSCGAGRPGGAGFCNECGSTLSASSWGSVHPRGVRRGSMRRSRLAETEPLHAQARAAYADVGAVVWLEELEQWPGAERVGT